jgi:hypothetical protein
MKTLKFTLQEVQSRLDCKWSATAGQNDGQLRSRCSQSWTAAPLPVQCWYAPDNITLCYFMHFGSHFAGLWNCAGLFCRVMRVHLECFLAYSTVLLGVSIVVWQLGSLVSVQTLLAEAASSRVFSCAALDVHAPKRQAGKFPLLQQSFIAVEQL